jgi:copper resistance protein C
MPKTLTAKIGFPKSILVIVAALLSFVSPAFSHAILLSSTPRSQEVVTGMETFIELRFNSRIDGKRSRLTLVKPDGALRGVSIGAQPSPDTLTAEVRKLQSGSYVLRWQVLASDGHITRGEVLFHVR